MISRLISILVIAWIVGFALFAAFLPRPAGDVKTDAIVVLTGGAGRIERGLDLIEAHRARRMLISGVDRRVRPHELAAQYQVPRAVFDCCVDLGAEAVDTRSNGEETAAWIARRRYRSVRLVTTDWHMARAGFELRHAIPRSVTIVEDAVPSEPGLTVLLKEYHKYLLRRGAVLVGL